MLIKEVIGNRDVLVGRLGSPISAVLIKAESVSVPQRSVAAAWSPLSAEDRVALALLERTRVRLRGLLRFIETKPKSPK
jgi:hypothetical protein